MSKVRENFIQAIEALPYDIDEELKHKNIFSILKDVTQKYVELFSTDDLEENDKICIQSMLTTHNSQMFFKENLN